MAQTFADTSASTKVAALVEKGIQAFDDKDVLNLQTCLKGILEAVDELHEELDDLPNDCDKQVDNYEEYERMTQLKGTRLPKLIRNCMSQEDSPQAFLLSAEINMQLNDWRSDNDNAICLHLIPEKVFRLMSNSQDLEVIKQAYSIAGKIISTLIMILNLNAEDRGMVNRLMSCSCPLLGPPFVDILLRIGMQYPEQFTHKALRRGIPTILEDYFCPTKYFGITRATAVIQRVLDAVAGIIANEASSPALLVFGLKCFSSVSTAEKLGELRAMINLWIQEALPRLTSFLDHPDHGVQAAVLEAFGDVIRSSPEIANQVVDDGIFVRVAAAINREEFDVVGDKALRLLWICIRKKPEDGVIEAIFQAQIPLILTQRLLLRTKIMKHPTAERDMPKAVAQLCIQNICEFIPLTLAQNLLESGTVLELLNYIKKDPFKLPRFQLLRAILNHLAPTLRNGHTPSFQALTQMISETVGLDVAKKIEAVEDPEDLGINSWDPEYTDGWDLPSHYGYYDSDRESDSDSDMENDSDPGGESDSDTD